MLLLEVGVRENVGLWSGIVFAVNFLTASVMAPVWGSLSDRVGKRPMMIRAGFGIASTYALMAFSHSVGELVLWRAVNGLLSGYIPAANTLVASNTPDSHLGRALGTLQAVAAAGLITGPLVGGLAAELVGPRGALLVSAALLAIAGILPAVVRIDERVDRPTRALAAAEVGGEIARDVRAVFDDRALRAMFVVQFLFTSAQVFVQPTLPLYIGQLVTRNVSLVTGAVYSMVGVATAVGAPLASRWADAAPARALRTGIAAAAVLYAFHALVPHAGYLAAVRFAFGLASSLVVVASSVLIATSVEPRHRGRTFGVLQSVNGLGGAVGPFLGGLLGDTLGLQAPFFAGALVVGAAWRLCPVSPPRAAAPAREQPGTEQPSAGRQGLDEGARAAASAPGSSASDAARLSTAAERFSASSSGSASGSSSILSMPDRPTTQGMPR